MISPDSRLLRFINCPDCYSLSLYQKKKNGLTSTKETSNKRTAPKRTLDGWKVGSTISRTVTSSYVVEIIFDFNSKSKQQNNNKGGEREREY